MWATLALSTVLSLTPGQASSLQLKNIRTTYGPLMQVRKDNKVLPGDLYFVCFDIAGLKVQDNGKVLYGMGIELTRKGKTKPEFKRDPQDLEAFVSLGGNTLPANAHVVIGTDTPPGEYTLNVTITDRAAKKSQKLSRDFEVIKPRLGFVRFGFTYDASPAPQVGVVGQTLLLHSALVGFTLDKKTNQPHFSMEVRVLDSKDQPVLKTPIRGDIKAVAKGFELLLPFDPIPLVLNRPGKFKVVLKATDKLSKRTVEQTLDLTVHDLR
jgi:hypothetical protein